MFIAFEGPDKAGKSTTAAELASDGVALYNATKAMHEGQRSLIKPGEVVTYDRIDWLTHMVYRLAMHGRDWNDDRPRTVFAMPDTHLVLKLHNPDNVVNIEDELYAGEGKLEPVNELYFQQISFLASMNRLWGHPWFKSVSIVEVHNDVKAGVFTQKLTHHESAAYSGTYLEVLGLAVTSNQDLLEFLREQDERIG
jgi:hypothetical protein